MYIIEINLREITSVVWAGLNNSGMDAAYFCGYDNEHSCSIKARYFLIS
jgi:hypothetical protein